MPAYFCFEFHLFLYSTDILIGILFYIFEQIRKTVLMYIFSAYLKDTFTDGSKYLEMFLWRETWSIPNPEGIFRWMTKKNFYKNRENSNIRNAISLKPKERHPRKLRKKCFYLPLSIALVFFTIKKEKTLNLP